MDLQQTQACCLTGCCSQSENCDSLAFLSKSAVSRLSESIWVSIAAGYCFTPRAFCCGRLDLGWEAAPWHLVPESSGRLRTDVRKYDDVDSEGHRNPVTFNF